MLCLIKELENNDINTNCQISSGFKRWLGHVDDIDHLGNRRVRSVR